LAPGTKKTTDDPAKLGLNLGPKASAEMASIGILTRAQLRALGWEKAFRKLVAKYPERLNLNMAAALIGAELGIDWRKIPQQQRQNAKALIKSIKPLKVPATSRRRRTDPTFVDFVLQDQLTDFAFESRKMFGGFGLYSKEYFFGIIYGDALYLRTNDQTRPAFVDAGMEMFRPNPRQVLKAYYQVPTDVLENAGDLAKWVRSAVMVAKRA
jgi:DNA transformation protein